MEDKWTVRKEPDSLGWIKETHPSYGTISISNTSSTGTPLFNSDVRHGHFISIRISEAHRNIDGTHEMVMADKQLIEINMTAAQFAEFITTPNRGSGTPCTLRYVAGDEPYEGVRFGRPYPPMPEPFTDKFKAEGRERMDLMIAHMERAKTMADNLQSGAERPTKANIGVMVHGLQQAIQEIRSNLPYVLKVLDEQTEQRMQKAATEFESYVSMRLQHMGLEALAAQAPRLTAGVGEVKTLPEEAS